MKAGPGANYVQTFRDKDGNHFDGGKSYRLHVPGEPAGGGLLVADAVRQRNPLDGPEPDERRGPLVLRRAQDERRRLVRPVLRARQRRQARRATGSRRFPAGASTRCSASTAPPRRCSTARGHCRTSSSSSTWEQVSRTTERLPRVPNCRPACQLRTRSAISQTYHESGSFIICCSRQRHRHERTAQREQRFHQICVTTPLGVLADHQVGRRRGQARTKSWCAPWTRASVKGDTMSSSKPGVPAATLASISTPDKVESRLGTLEFDDGAPSEATAALLYDHLDFVHGVQAFLGALPGASLAAVRRGFLSIGRRGQLVPVVLGADGLGVAVPDRATATRSTSGASSTCRTGRW